MVAHNSKRSNKILYIVLIAVIVILALFVFQRAAKAVIKFLLKTAERVERIKEPWRSLIFIGCLMTFQLTFIPAQSTFIILMSFILKSYLHSISLQAISSTTSACLTYLLAKRCLRTRLENKYKNMTLYKVALKESCNHPWKLNLAFRVMYIPVTFKNVILSLTGRNFGIYLAGLVPAILFFGSLYTLIGLSLKNISEFYKPDSFGK